MTVAQQFAIAMNIEQPWLSREIREGFQELVRRIDEVICLRDAIEFFPIPPEWQQSYVEMYDWFIWDAQYVATCLSWYGREAASWE